jgi:hypothetical protein
LAKQEQHTSLLGLVLLPDAKELASWARLEADRRRASVMIAAHAPKFGSGEQMFGPEQQVRREEKSN